MNGKRITIYNIAEALGISASYVSRALNDHPLVSSRIRDLVKKKAADLHYRHNSHAANLRQGSSKTIGVIVPHIDQRFFSDVIAGIEEICFENNHSLIICQSHDSFEQESAAIDTLIHQNVDCILISLSAATRTSSHLENITRHGVELVQFDRVRDDFKSFKVTNDNKVASSRATKSLIDQGYRKIAFLGGPAHVNIFKHRKDGYLQAIKNAGLSIAGRYIVDDVLSKEKAMAVAEELLSLKYPPDAFLTVSDHQSLGVLQVARSKNISVPDNLGIFGFANEVFADIIQPALSSVDQKSKHMGKTAATMYMKNLKNLDTQSPTLKEIVKCEIIVRESSRRS